MHTVSTVDQLKKKNQLLEDKLYTQELATSSLSEINHRGSDELSKGIDLFVLSLKEFNY